MDHSPIGIHAVGRRTTATDRGLASDRAVRPSPLATIRLENFPDGLEDYAYFRILEGTVAKVEASADLRAQRGEWLTQA